MKIVFYNETLLSGGIEKCMETLIEELYKIYDIEIVYIDEKKLDENIVKVLSKHAYVHKLDLNKCIEADICIWCRLYIDYNLLQPCIKAKKNILWVHSKPVEMENYVLNNEKFMENIDKVICVSKTVQNVLPDQSKSDVIHNFLPKDIIKFAEASIDENVFYNEGLLKLVTVSRISAGKGFDRILKLVKTLKKKGLNFEYIIIGKGRKLEKEIKENFKEFDEVKFIGYKENPYPYIKKADYLVQLSDYETWGNVITEAKSLGTPVIITNFESAYEQVQDDYNGVIISLEENDYSKYFEKIINNHKLYKRNLLDYKYENEIEKWLEILK